MKQVFHIIPASGNSLWIILIFAMLLMVAFVLLFGFIAWSYRHVKFEITPAGLKITGDIYGRTVPLSDLLPEQAKTVDLDKNSSYRFVSRTNGIGLPGYKSGWFRTQSGQKALAFVTRTTQVVYLPTAKGYSIFLSVQNPEEFIDCLRGNADSFQENK